jgi:hypothetical protein
MPQTRADAAARAKLPQIIDKAATDADNGKNAEEGNPKDTSMYECKNKEKFNAAESNGVQERWWAGW